MRPRSDRGSRCTDKDRSKETEDRALISAIKHIQVCLRRLYYSLVKADPCFSFKSLALQDSNNRASDDEPAMVQYRSMMVGNAVVAHKASAGEITALEIY